MSTAGGFGSYNIPGQTDIYQSIEGTIGWGGFFGPFLWDYGVINSATVDAGNTPTTFLRPGLLLGFQTSSNNYLQYSGTAVDGTEIATAILAIDLDMLDPYSNADQSRACAVLVGGPVKSTTIIGLDQQARSQMRGRFIFDDDLPQQFSYFPYKCVIPKTASYQLLSSDQGTLFVANGSLTTVFTLPAITTPLGYGYYFGFVNRAQQVMEISSSEGANIYSDNAIASNNVAFNTTSHERGAYVDFLSIFDGTNYVWLFRQYSVNATTLTIT